MITGIYILRFKNTDKVYVGQSLDIKRRFAEHLNTLKQNLGAAKLQEAYNTYGMPTYEILVECEAQELNQNENLAIEIFNSVKNGFNTVCEINQMHRGNLSTGENAPNAKYTNQQILEIAKLLCDPNLTFVQISKLTNIPYSSIKKIYEGKNHTWIQKDYPNLWNSIQQVKDKRLENIYKLRAENNKKLFSANAQGINYPKVTDSSGNLYEITNLSEFCRIHNLENDRTNFRNMLKGRRKSCKGWSLAIKEVPYTT